MVKRANSTVKRSERKRAQDGTHRQDGSKGLGANVTLGTRRSNRLHGGGGGSKLLFDDEIGTRKSASKLMSETSGKVSSTSASGAVSIPLDAVQSIYSIAGKYIQATNNNKTVTKNTEFINDDTPMVALKMDDLYGLFDALSLGEIDTARSSDFKDNNFKIMEPLRKAMKIQQLNSEVVNELETWLVKSILLCFWNAY